MENLIEYSNLPIISIIIGVKNADKFLAKALNSIFIQSYPKLDIIVMDGGSTDGTLEIIKSYSSKIAYWQSEPDSGYGEACNKARSFIKGDLVCSLNADDWYENNILWDVAKVYMHNPECDLITCGGRVVAYNKQGDPNNKLSFQGESALKLSLKNICEGVSAINCRFFSKALWDKVGIYHEMAVELGIKLTIDKDLLIRTMLERPKCTYINKLGYTYLSHTDSATFSPEKKSTLYIYDEHKKLAKIFMEEKRLFNFKQRMYFRYWYVQMSIKKALYLLRKGKIRDGLVELKRCLLQFPLSFLYCSFFILFWLPYSLLKNQLYINRVS